MLGWMSAPARIFMIRHGQSAANADTSIYNRVPDYRIPLTELGVEQARAAAGEKDVGIAGGASVAQQYLKAGQLDELLIHVAPILIGDGVRLFDDPGPDQVELECTEVIQSPAVTHLRYRVVR